jgi:hypothetical protein
MMGGALRYIQVLAHWLAKPVLRRRLFQTVLPPDPGPETALNNALGWLKSSQDQTEDPGCSTFYPAHGWTSSYPETTGYIVETWYRSLSLQPDPDLEQRAAKALDWLVDIQKPSGGWQSGYIHQNKLEVVFNTGQVIRGLLAGWQYTGNLEWKASLERACHWLVAIQHPDGFWDRFVYLDRIRVYDTYVAAPLWQAGALLGHPAWQQAALKNAKWVLDSKMTPNGWLPDADNTIQHNDRPIVHTLAYTYDGLVDLALWSGGTVPLEPTLVPLKELAHRFLKHGFLQGRYNHQWKGSEAMILTGSAQLAIVWWKLHRAGIEGPWLDAARSMNAFLRRCQEQVVPQAMGALPGSHPIWGRYEPFGYPNWATKYLADALILELEQP